MAEMLDFYGEDAPPPPPAPRGVAPPAAEGFLDNLTAGFTNKRLEVRPDRMDAGDLRLNREYGPLLDALDLPASENPVNFSNGWGVQGMDMRPSRLKPGGRVTRAQQEALIATEIARRQAADPAFLKGIPNSVEGLRKWFVERENARQAAAADKVDRTEGAGGWIGAIGGALFETAIDTPNLLTLPIGGWGKTVAQRLLTEGLAGAGSEMVQQPGVAANRAELGQDFTAGEAALNVVTAGAGAALLRGGIEGGVKGAAAAGRKIDAAFPDAARARAASALGKAMERAIRSGRFDEAALGPLAARLFDPAGGVDVARSVEAGTIDDRALAEAFKASVPEENRTADERAALAQIERDAEIREASPFEPTPEADPAHQRGL